MHHFPKGRLSVILVAFLIVSCVGNDRSQNAPKIHGKLASPAKGFAYLEILTPEGFEKLDSTEIAQDGTFLLQAQKSQPEIYRINLFNKQKFSFTLNDQDIWLESAYLNGDFSGRGTNDIEAVTQASRLQSTFSMQISLLNQEMRSTPMQQDSVLNKNLRDRFESAEVAYRNSLKQLISEQNGSITAILLLNEYIPIEPNLDFYEEQIPIIKGKMNESWIFNDLQNQVQNIKKLALGSVAPEFSLEDPDGKLIHLSDFKGKYLYLDFWASWCQPCRMENPDLVKVYEKYKDSDFEILGVSFDKKKENWLKAIADDGLGWQHVSDLKYFDSELIGLYNIEGIPMTFLLNPKGEIIAKNIHADDLEHILAEKLESIP